MGRFNELVITVGEMVDQGLSDSDIAELNHITLEQVQDIVSEWYPAQSMTDEDTNDGQPDEMQEWHDFDPDC